MLGSSRKRGSGDVWIVLDESPDAPQLVLGVFDSQDQARAFVDAHVPGEFAELAYGRYEVGWTFDGSRYAL
jgi:hypothetical protein